MPAAPPRASQASVRASASAKGAASVMPARSKPSASACALTSAARAIRSPGAASGTGASAGALIAPGDEALDRLAVERRAEAEDDVCAARVGERVEVRQVLAANTGRPLNRAWIAAQLRAPVVQHAVLAAPVLHAAKAVPGVGVL